MNNSFEESLLSLLMSAGPPLIALVAIFCLGVFLITGYSMKFALAAAGVGRFGFWKSIGIVVLTTIATMVVSAIAAFAVPNNPILMLFVGLFAIVAYAMVIAFVGRCGIGSGFKAYLYNGLFGTIGMVVFMIGFAGIVMVAAPMIDIDQEALARIKQGMPNQERLSADSFDQGFDQGFDDEFGSLNNVSFPAPKSFMGEPSEDSETLSGKRFAAPVNSSDDEVQDAFYRPVPKKTSETGRSNALDNGFKGVRQNPFVK